MNEIVVCLCMHVNLSNRAMLQAQDICGTSGESTLWSEKKLHPFILL